MLDAGRCVAVVLLTTPVSASDRCRVLHVQRLGGSRRARRGRQFHARGIRNPSAKTVRLSITSPFVSSSTTTRLMGSRNPCRTCGRNAGVSRPRGSVGIEIITMVESTRGSAATSSAWNPGGSERFATFRRRQRWNGCRFSGRRPHVLRTFEKTGVVAFRNAHECQRKQVENRGRNGRRVIWSPAPASTIIPGVDAASGTPWTPVGFCSATHK